MSDPVTQQVLEQLDAAADEFVFPDLGHRYYDGVDARLHAFSDGTRWAHVIDTVGYDPRAGNVVDVVHTFSNCLASGTPGPVNGDFHDRIENMDLIEDEDEPETYRGDVPLVVRGRPIPVDARAGEDLVNVFRQLVPEHRDLLLADDAELRRRIPADLPLVLRLDEWHHPDPFDQRPSTAEVFVQLAQVLSTVDTERYRPTLPPNTHYSNWPQSGSL